MKASELRIMNYVMCRGALSQVSIIKQQHIGYFKSSGAGEDSLPLEFVQPITLTEEWLLKFGFEEIIGNVENSKCFRHPKCSLIVYFDGTRLSVNFWQGNEKKYVHQLQNFYFALTNEELTYEQQK